MQIKKLLNVYQDAGTSDYIGEPVSQLAHAQQAALLAKNAGASNAVVLGAFFHDIGHLCAPDGSPQMDGLGVLEHESVGASFLRDCGVYGTVSELVELHVQAKRYLCWRSSDYEARLSSASRGTLLHQGGVMDAVEAESFERHPLFKDILRLRAWDEAAKMEGVEGLALEEVERRLKDLEDSAPVRSEDMDRWTRDGFLHLPGFFPEADRLSTWTEELMSWPETAGKWMKYFETAANGSNDRLLCRVENFLQFHAGWASIIHSPRLMEVLERLLGEPACLFKEKINFKLPGGSGFAAHQDAPAFAAFGQRMHITAMVSIDGSTEENGCLEMAPGQHCSGLHSMTKAQVLTEEAVAKLEWIPLETQPGDLVLFGSFIPHRSAENRSMKARRAAYLTYNGRSDGSHRQAYFEQKRAVFPPEVERVDGRDYSDSGMFNIGNPIRN